ncbi:group 1 truncated hemoglobin [Herbaspirillum sp. RTI4]|uniref:group I truncated hemoglobin n=1 Tax=Herbaspirillum sp. RTI4 TaxID=3048640 RepID=UPI002AB3C728|nr:group 1 truncated hemoglobin [Herbaspirillum sp. RTI4]MDY7578902.1 group 1 truncated hemoglobin [Herbaspirillum sp. RTI4]MEA9981991.1 group 1 truncated hemoglobin [Herbaspirillum sp. RTI4]
MRKFSFLPLAMLMLMLLLTLSSARAETTETLYDSLGGQAVINNIVDGFLKIALDDPRIKETFSESEMKRLRAMLAEHLCKVVDGPCVYTGDPMKEVHQGLGINQARFNAMTEDFQTAMVQLSIPAPIQYRVLARLAPMQRDIISR